MYSRNAIMSSLGDVDLVDRAPGLDCYPNSSLATQLLAIRKSLESAKPELIGMFTQVENACKPGDKLTDDVMQDLLNALSREGVNVDVSGGSEAFGGCACGGNVTGAMFGGVESYAKYQKSLYSGAKTQLIKTIGKEVAEIFGKRVDTSNVEEIHRVLKSLIPDPKSVRVHTNEQARVCDKLVKMVNNVNKTPIISERDSYENKLQSVNDYIGSLFTNMHSEFIGVAKDVREKLDALDVLVKMLSAGKDRYERLLNTTQDSMLLRESEGTKYLMDEVISEADKQMSMLRNLLNIAIRPTEVSLLESVEKQTALKSLASRLKNGRAMVGSTSFGENLAQVLDGTESVTFAAKVINDALKTVGMTVDEYKRTSSLTELNSKLFDRLRANKKSKFEDLTKFVQASELLRRNNYRRSDIVRAMGGKSTYRNSMAKSKKSHSKKSRSKKRGGYYGAAGSDSESDASALSDASTASTASIASTASTASQSGDSVISDVENVDQSGLPPPLQQVDDPSEYSSEQKGVEITESRDEGFYGSAERRRKARKSGKKRGGATIDDIEQDTQNPNRLLSRIKVQDKNKKSIQRDFASKLSSFYKSLMDSVDRGIRRLGKEVELSDKTDRLNKALDGLDETLSTDTSTLVSALLGNQHDAEAKVMRERFISNFKMLSTAARDVPVMAEVARDADAIAAMVDDYFDVMKSVRAVPIVLQRSTADGTKLGGAVDDDIADAVSSSIYDIKGVVSRFRYGYYAAQIRFNLNVLAPEHKLTGEKYEDLLGTAIASRINAIKAEYDDYITKFAVQGNVTYKAEHKDVNVTLFEANETHDMGPIQLAEFKKFLVGIRNTRTKFYETLEAIDLYLSGFTDGIVSAPEDLGDLIKMIDSLQVNIRWYNNQAGDDFAMIFDQTAKYGSIPGFIGGAGATFANIGTTRNTANNQTIQYDMYNVDVAVPKMPNLKKDRPNPFKGHQFRSGKSADDTYADFIRRLISTGEPVKVFETDATPTIPSNYRNYWMGAYVCGFSDPFTCMTPLMANNAIKYTAKTMSSITVLKNIVSTFVHIGKRFGDSDLLSKATMSPTQIYKNLLEYMVVSAYTNAFNHTLYDGTGTVFSTAAITNTAVQSIKSLSLHYAGTSGNVGAYTNNAGGVNAGTELDDIIIGTNDREHINGDNTKNHYGRHATAALTGELCMHRVPTSVYMRSIEYQPGNIVRGLPPAFMQIWLATGDATAANQPFRVKSPHFSEDDKFFKLAIQAMCAKVMTAVGTYTMLAKPNQTSKGMQSTGLVRQILGAADDLTTPDPEVKMEISELYVRLLLLIEYYREIFDLSGSTPVAITMIPELFDVWSPLIDLVFVDAAGVKNGSYSLDQVKRIIRAVNDIYFKYKPQLKTGNPTRELILNFVAEINRRFGVFYKGEVDSWLASKKIPGFDRDAQKNDTDFNILPDESEPSYPRQAPSSRYLGVDKRASTTIDNLKTDAYYELIKSFRDRVAKTLEGADLKTMAQYSFRESVGQLHEMLKNATTNAEKIKVVADAIYGAGKLTSVSSDKVLMFHESVIVPLYTAAIGLNEIKSLTTGADAMLHGAEVLEAFANLVKAASSDTATVLTVDRAGLLTVAALDTDYYTMLNKFIEKYSTIDTRIFKGIRTNTPAGGAGVTTHVVTGTYANDTLLTPRYTAYLIGGKIRNSTGNAAPNVTYPFFPQGSTFYNSTDGKALLTKLTLVPMTVATLSNKLKIANTGNVNFIPTAIKTQFINNTQISKSDQEMYIADLKKSLIDRYLNVIYTDHGAPIGGVDHIGSINNEGATQAIGTSIQSQSIKLINFLTTLGSADVALRGFTTADNTPLSYTCGVYAFFKHDLGRLKIVSDMMDRLSRLNTFGSVTISGSGTVIVDTSKYNESIEALVKGARRALDKFRGVMTKDIIKSVELADEFSVKNVESLLDTYIRGRTDRGSTVETVQTVAEAASLFIKSAKALAVYNDPSQAADQTPKIFIDLGMSLYPHIYPTTINQLDTSAGVDKAYTVNGADYKATTELPVSKNALTPRVRQMMTRSIPNAANISKLGSQSPAKEISGRNKYAFDRGNSEISKTELFRQVLESDPIVNNFLAEVLARNNDIQNDRNTVNALGSHNFASITGLGAGIAPNDQTKKVANLIKSHLITHGFGIAATPGPISARAKAALKEINDSLSSRNVTADNVNLGQNGNNVPGAANQYSVGYTTQGGENLAIQSANAILRVTKQADQPFRYRMVEIGSTPDAAPNISPDMATPVGHMVQYYSTDVATGTLVNTLKIISANNSSEYRLTNFAKLQNINRLEARNLDSIIRSLDVLIAEHEANSALAWADLHTVNAFNNSQINLNATASRITPRDIGAATVLTTAVPNAGGATRTVLEMLTMNCDPYTNLNDFQGLHDKAAAFDAIASLTIGFSIPVMLGLGGVDGWMKYVRERLIAIGKIGSDNRTNQVQSGEYSDIPSGPENARHIAPGTPFTILRGVGTISSTIQAFIGTSQAEINTPSNYMSGVNSDPLKRLALSRPNTEAYVNRTNDSTLPGYNNNPTYFNTLHVGVRSDPDEAESILLSEDQYSTVADNTHCCAGLIGALNVALAKYLNVIISEPYNQVYIETVDALLSSGSGAKMITGKTIQAMWSTQMPFINKDASDGAVVDASIGYIFRRIALEMARDSPEYLVTDVTQLHESYKESLRGQLCFIRILFMNIIKKALLLRSLITVVGQSAMSIIDERYAFCEQPSSNPMSFPVNFAQKIPEPNYANFKWESNFVSTIDHITSIAKSVIKCIDNTSKNIDDAPVYGETYRGSIADYRLTNSVNPLVPISLLTHAYIDGCHQNVSIGDARFKWEYATRAALCYTIRGQDLQGPMRLVEQYNNASDPKSRLDKSDMERVFELTSRMISTHRLNTEAAYGNLGVRTNLVTKYNSSTVIPYQVKTSTGATKTVDVVDVLENGNQSHFLQLLSRQVGLSDTVMQTRDDLRKYNIIDLNIVPVNFHALRRDIPLVNIMNYAYTFVDSVKGVRGSGVGGDFVRTVLTDPYSPTLSIKSNDQNMHLDPVYRFMTGLSGTGLGRPKFLSDQVWNKALFMPLYLRSDDDALEAGPGGAQVTNIAADIILTNTKGSNRKGEIITTKFNMGHTSHVELNVASGIKLYLAAQGLNADMDGKVMMAGLNAGNHDRAAADVIEYRTKIFRNEGRHRFDTMLTRNMMFLVTSHMYLRDQIRSQLEHIDTPVLEKLSALSRHVTEFTAVQDPEVELADALGRDL